MAKDLTRDERQALLNLTVTPGWQVVKTMAQGLVDRQKTHLASDNFQDLFLVGRCQGEVHALESLIETVEAVAKRASSQKEDS